MADNMNNRIDSVGRALDGKLQGLRSALPLAPNPTMPMADYLKAAEQEALRNPEFAKQLAFSLGQYQGRRDGRRQP